MKDRILSEPAFCMGLLVWAVAATVFPLQLGLAGATIFAFAAYLAIAGLLLAAADAVLHPALYNRMGDVVLQAVFWAIGLAVPALIAFGIGAASAPTHAAFNSDLCALGGLEGGPMDPDDRSDGPLEDALEALDNCEPR